MNSDYQQKKMMNALGAIDTKGNIVLEQFQDGTALLFQPGNAQPFCVATDYDRATASWSYGKYFSDLDARVTILKENGNFRSVDTAMPVASLDELEQYRSDRLADKVTSLKDSLDSQYKADEHGRVFDRPCQVLDDGNLDEH